MDPYETLGLSRDASPADVKRAYFRLVKVHTPEDDPDRFQAISEAYRVLSDPEARKAYDAVEPLPPGVAEQIARAEELVEKEPDKAVAQAKRVLATKGLPLRARIHVASLCVRAGRPNAALPLSEAIVRDAPNDPEAHAARGHVLSQCGKLDLARRSLERALALDADHLGATLALANVLARQDHVDEALKVLDGALARHGDETVRALPLLFQRFRVLASDGRFDAMTGVVRRIAATVPAGDADAASHVASQWSDLAYGYDQARVWDVAKIAIDAALGFVEHEGLRERSAALADVVPTLAEVRAALRDKGVPDWIRSLLPQHIGQRLSEADWERLVRGIAGRIRRKPSAADREWNAFRGRYPAAAGLLEEQWTALRARGGAKSSAGSFSGVGVVVVLVLGLFRLGTCDARSSSPEPAIPILTPPRVSAADMEDIRKYAAATEPLRNVLKKLSQEAEPQLSAEETRLLRETDAWRISFHFPAYLSSAARARLKERLGRLGIETSDDPLALLERRRKAREDRAK